MLTQIIALLHATNAPLRGSLERKKNTCLFRGIAFELGQ